MYTLYYTPGSCSFSVHVALEEVGAKYKLENVATPDGVRPPEFLKINPRGSVPVLDHDGFIQREGAAILITLLDEHKSPLLPASGNARASALEWLAFANSTLHPAYGRMFGMHKLLGDKATENEMYDFTVAQIQRWWDDVEKRLSTSAYLAGEQCTIADILVTVIANWTPNAKKPILFGPKTKAFFAKVIARPAYAKALADENVTYKVAA